MAADASGLYVAGTNSSGTLILKLDENATLLWAMQSSATFQSPKVVLNASGNACLVGGLNNAGVQISVFSPSGTLLTSYAYDPVKDANYLINYFRDVALDSSGNFYLCGGGQFDLGSAVAGGVGWVAKIQADGTPVWLYARYLPDKSGFSPPNGTAYTYGSIAVNGTSVLIGGSYSVWYPFPPNQILHGPLVARSDTTAGGLTDILWGALEDPFGAFSSYGEVSLATDSGSGFHASWLYNTGATATYMYPHVAVLDSTGAFVTQQTAGFLVSSIFTSTGSDGSLWIGGSASGNTYDANLTVGNAALTAIRYVGLNTMSSAMNASFVRDVASHGLYFQRGGNLESPYSGGVKNPNIIHMKEAYRATLPGYTTDTLGNDHTLYTPSVDMSLSAWSQPVVGIAYPTDIYTHFTGYTANGAPPSWSPAAPGEPFVQYTF
jgi:hypothetical protein